MKLEIGACYKIRVKALWLQPEVGMEGYIGAIRSDGIPFALCSVEKWNLGQQDSLRKGWKSNIRFGDKILYTDISNKEINQLVKEGQALNEGSNLELKVPECLKSLLKKK